MGAFVSVEGIKYRFKRHFRSTAYDQEKLKNSKIDDISENPDKDIAKALVSSLQVNAVSDLPTFVGVRYVGTSFGVIILN